MAGNTIDDVVVGIRLELDKRSERAASDSLTSFRRKAMKALAPITGAIGLQQLTKMTTGIIEMKDQANLLGKQLKMNSGELYRMEVAGNKFKTSMTQNLLNLQELFAGLGMEDMGGLLGKLSKFGLNITPMINKADYPKALFDELAKQWQNLNTEQRVKTGQTLGLDQGMMNLLNNQGRYQGYLSETKAPTKEEMEEARQAKKAMDELGLNVKNLLNSIATGLTPAITTLSEKLGDIDGEAISKSINTMVAIVARYFNEDSTPLDELNNKDLSDKAFSLNLEKLNPFISDKRRSEIDKEIEEIRSIKARRYDPNKGVTDEGQASRWRSIGVDPSTLPPSMGGTGSKDLESKVNVENQTNNFTITTPNPEETKTEIENMMKEAYEDVKAGN